VAEGAIDMNSLHLPHADGQASDTICP